MHGQFFCFPFPPLSGFLPSAPPHGQSRQPQQAPGSRRRFRDQIRRHGSLMKYSNHFSLRTTPERSRRIATDHITKLKVENMTEQEKNRPRESSDWRGLMEKNPGGDLLLRDLSSDYHWRGSVSLPGSERDRVGPLRSGHRASGGRGDFFFILPARETCFFGGF